MGVCNAGRGIVQRTPPSSVGSKFSPGLTVLYILCSIVENVQQHQLLYDDENIRWRTTDISLLGT